MTTLVDPPPFAYCVCFKTPCPCATWEREVFGNDSRIDPMRKENNEIVQAAEQQ